MTVWGLTCTIISLLIMTDWQAIGSDPCMKYSLFHHPQLADQYRMELAQSNVSESGMVSVQSLQVVEGEVYQMAVNRCESAGEHCHWIPNSLVTHKHCSDCQPICRNTQHTLNFVQFMFGVMFFFSTSPLLYSGVFWLLSECVSKKYQVYVATFSFCSLNSTLLLCMCRYSTVQLCVGVCIDDMTCNNDRKRVHNRISSVLYI